MIDDSTVTKAVETVLASITATVERCTRMNMDPGRCPWVGIYPGPSIDSILNASGSGNQRWNNQVDVMIVAQHSSYNNDGQEASDNLDTLVDAILAAINTDLRIGIGATILEKVNRKRGFMQTDKNETGDLFFPVESLICRFKVLSS